ncbi:hypothetical protein [Maribacter sp. 2304DJ31-5]|uniref:hypothetical protein n=1 Tax=Maribacter sp. 2304DJ31-5 TaxID=3386273 RepID=UPI0039BC7B6D
MNTNRSNFRQRPSLRVKENSNVVDLDVFLRYLEQYYISEVTVSNCVNKQGTISFALDMKCPIGLLGVLGHFNKERWGYNGTRSSPLKSAFDSLQEKNGPILDIEELTLSLNDTNIIIKRLYNRSIVEQIDAILNEIGNHYVFLTKGLTEKPYEIFLPVYEDYPIEDDIVHAKNPCIYNSPDSYFQYWGIYLESQEDALIYDVQKNVYLSGNLDLCMLYDY